MALKGFFLYNKIFIIMELEKLQKLPFKEIIAYIDENFEYTASSFKNGTLMNAESENQGSAKTLYFAKLNNLSVEDTLRLFAEHYQAVLGDKEGSSHQNIRNFMQNGWEGVEFEKEVLQGK